MWTNETLWQKLDDDWIFDEHLADKTSPYSTLQTVTFKID